MKIRNGFVSNSSSSSFMITSNRNKKDIRIRIDVSIGDLVERVIETKDDLIEYFQDEYYFNPSMITEDSKYSKLEMKQYNNMLENYINKGKKIMIVGISNDESPISSFLYYNNDDLTNDMIINGEIFNED